jgi:hypothetical protein
MSSALPQSKVVPQTLGSKKNACYILLHIYNGDAWCFFHGPAMATSGISQMGCSAQDTFAIIPRHFAEVYFSTWGNPEPRWAQLCPAFFGEFFVKTLGYTGSLHGSIVFGGCSRGSYIIWYLHSLRSRPKLQLWAEGPRFFWDRCRWWSI